MKVKGDNKFKTIFHGPYRGTIKVVEVAYEFKLLEGSKIHIVFHNVFHWGKGYGIKDIPPIYYDGKLEMIPENIFQFI